MKKYFLSLVAIAAAMLFATSCQESLVEPQIEGPTTFTVQLPDAMGTKAIGDKENVNQLLVAVYSEATGDAVALTRATATSTSGQFKVQFNLLQDQSYDIVFWAQVEDKYVSSTGDFDLKSIPMTNIYHNNENGAAFFAYVANFVPTGSAQSVTLKRPFAQLNLGTTEQSLQPATGEVSLVSSEIKIKGLAQSFNTILGMGEDPTTEVVTYYATIPEDWQKLSAAGSQYEYVSMDYLPIVGDDKAVFDIEANIVVKDAAGEKNPINHKFTSVPVQENYRTNIVGNLISSTSDFIVSIDDRFEEDYSNTDDIISNDYLVVDNVYEAQVAFGKGETHVAINNIGNTQTLQLPDNGKELYLQLPDSDGQITIKRDAGNFNILVPDTNPLNTGLTIKIVAPNSTVDVTGQANVIYSTTASNTLNLNGAKVGTIIVKKGNVVAQNNTTVSNLTVDDNLTEKVELKIDDTSSIIVPDTEKDEVTYIIEISSAEELIALSASVDDRNTYEGTTIVLTEDIDLTGVTTDGDSFGPIGRYCSGQGVNAPFKGDFDGQGHTIKGIYQSGWDFGYEWGTTGYLGLFGYVMDATIENLTIDGMESVVEGGTLAAIAGRADGECTFKNITVKNTKLGTYNNRCGGIVGWTGGYYKDEAKTEVACYFTFENINICDDVVLGGLWGSFDSSIGGIMGQLNSAGSASFKNVTVSCRIDAYNDCTASYDYYNYRMCGMLIGQLTKTTEIDGSTYPDVAAYNIKFDNVTVNYGTWMNYHYCEPTPGLNGGRGMRVEAGFTYDGLPADFDHTQCVDNHYNCIPFDQLFGGTQTACKGVKAWDGVTVNYPDSYTCPLCGKQHNE